MFQSKHSCLVVQITVDFICITPTSWSFPNLKVKMLKIPIKSNPVLIIFLVCIFSARAIQCIYLQQLPLYTVVFMSSGGVPHFSARFRLPSEVRGICMHVIWH